MIRTPPLELRNRLAEIVLAALHDPAAREDLARIAETAAALPPWCAGAAAPEVALVRARARRATEALAGGPRLAREPSLAAALRAAAALFDAGLHFEVHELLEPHWTRATGPRREVLQGLIQIAVGYQHLANGNVGGARALLAEGSRRLRDAASDVPLSDHDLRAFADAVSAAAATIGATTAAAVPPFPRHHDEHATDASAALARGEGRGSRAEG